MKIENYLSPSEAIDFDNPLVADKAKELSSSSETALEMTKKCYEFVRDEICHCVDFDMNPVTCRASEVLIHRTGFCFAKSHLLAALLRACSIPAGLCYQRITCHLPGQPFCLHGLVAVYLDEYGWYRIDPRGNKEGVHAGFNPPKEQLAFQCNLPGEYMLPEIWAEPPDSVRIFLTTHTDYKKALNKLPDIESFEAKEKPF